MSSPTHNTNAAAWVAPSAELYGDIRIRENASIWPQVVMRAEATYAEVGACTNLQDFVMVHFGSDGASVIGDYCSITHHATIHGATIGNCCLIGINATIMDGAKIGNNCIVAGHTIIREGTVIPDNSIVAGVPGKVVGTRNNYVANKLNAIAYRENALAYARGHYRRWSDPDYEAYMQAQQALVTKEFEQQFGQVQQAQQ